MKKKWLLCAVIIINGLSFSGCRNLLEMPVGAPVTEEEIQPADGVSQYEITALDYDIPEGQEVEIDLNRLTESPEGLYTCENRILTIWKPGSYRLSGRWEDGSIHVNVFEDETVCLLLNNVEINSAQGAAIHVENAAKVVITAGAGTENILSANFSQEEVRQACIFSNSDLTINGSGFLSVYSYHADGIRSKDQLKIVNANLYVKAKEDGLRGNDGVILEESSSEVECEGTGILSGSGKDLVVLRGGRVKVVAGINAISANQYVSVKGTILDLYSVLETIHCDGIRDLEEVPSP